MNINPYLDFEGRCDEAIAFYKGAVGAEVTWLMRFKEAPAGSCPEGAFPAAILEKVMHAELSIGKAKVFLSDGYCTGTAKFHGISLALEAANDAEAERVFKALGEGGKVTMPMGKTFFASSFGMVSDKFGVAWMVLKHLDV